MARSRSKKSKASAQAPASAAGGKIPVYTRVFRRLKGWVWEKPEIVYGESEGEAATLEKTLATIAAYSTFFTVGVHAAVKWMEQTVESRHGGEILRKAAVALVHLAICVLVWFLLHSTRKMPTLVTEHLDPTGGDKHMQDAQGVKRRYSFGRVERLVLLLALLIVFGLGGTYAFTGQTLGQTLGRFFGEQSRVPFPEEIARKIAPRRIGQFTKGEWTVVVSEIDLTQIDAPGLFIEANLNPTEGSSSGDVPIREDGSSDSRWEVS